MLCYANQNGKGEGMSNKKKGISLMLFSAFATCSGQLMWKLSATGNDQALFLIIGFALYALGAILMISAFQFGEVSMLQPMLSIGFVISLVLGRIVLNESINAQKITGVILIVIGMFFLGRNSRSQQ